MQLWTIQSLRWYNKLQESGAICGARKHITQDWESSVMSI